jgi:hypothetical protein
MVKVARKSQWQQIFRYGSSSKKSRLVHFTNILFAKAIIWCVCWDPPTSCCIIAQPLNSTEVNGAGKAPQVPLPGVQGSRH